MRLRGPPAPRIWRSTSWRTFSCGNQPAATRPRPSTTHSASAASRRRPRGTKRRRADFSCMKLVRVVYDRESVQGGCQRGVAPGLQPRPGAEGNMANRVKQKTKKRIDAPAGRRIGYAVVGLGYIAQVAVLPAFAHAKRNSALKALVAEDAEKLGTLRRGDRG